MTEQELPTGWQWTTIGEVCRVVPGFAFKSKDWTDTGIPVIKIKNIKSDCSVDVSEADCVPEEIVTEKLNKFRLHKGDILIAMTGATAGKVGWLSANGDFLLNQRVAKLEPLKINKLFFWGVVSGRLYQDLFFHLADGAAQPNMSGKQIEGVKIPLPPIIVQERIASVVSAYDDLIENNTRRIVILEEMARRLYEEWFVHFRFPGHEEVDFTETELGAVPMGWSVVPMQEICRRITDGAHKSPPSTETGMPMASVKDMHDWGFFVEKCRRISEADYEELVRNDCRPLVGDVVIAKDGSYLKHTFAIEKELDLVLLSSVAILRPNERVLPDFLALALRHPDVVARMKGVVSGVAIPRIVLKDFRAFKLTLPPSNLQYEWHKLAGPMLTMCRRLVDANANLRSQRDLLLPKLVSGEIDVSEVEEAMEAAE